MQDSCAPPKPIFKSPYTEINKHRNLVGLFASHCTLLYGGFRNLKKKTNVFPINLIQKINSVPFIPVSMEITGVHVQNKMGPF